MTQDHPHDPRPTDPEAAHPHTAAPEPAPGSAADSRPSRAILRKAANEAQEQGDYAAAIAQWAAFRQHYPGTKIGFIGGMRAAKAAQQDDVLAALMQESAVKFPKLSGRLGKLEKRGKKASRGDRAGRAGRPARAARADTAAGAARADTADRAIRADRPDRAGRPGRADKADRATRPGRAGRAKPDSAGTDADDENWQAMMQLPPTDAAAELEAAMAPFKVKQRRDRSARFKISRARVEMVVQRFPRDAASRNAHISVLRRMKRGGKAVALAAKYAAEFPKSEKLALAHIGTLDDAKQFEAALERATALKASSSPSVKVEVAYIQALSRVSKLDAADAACKQALAAFPDNVDLMCEHASLATRRGDWTEALARWMSAETIQPTSKRIKASLEAVRYQLAELQLPGTEFQEGETGQFFAQFESMGGTDHGCEFGIVQRKYGSASLGLLRWSAIEIDKLTEALNKGFEGLGLLENTALGTIRVTATREEWLIRDKVYGIGSHTFIDVKDVPEDKMLMQTARRLKFLGGKLLEDIASGLKILVYKIMHPVEDEQIRALYQAVRRQGPTQLLCIMKADDANARASLRKLEDGLLVGYIGHYMSEAEAAGEDKGIDFALWKDLTTRAASEFAPLRAP